MTNPQTRGYLVGINSSKRFVIPKKLMEKIVETSGETVLMLWIPYKKTLQIQPVDTLEVVKVTVWFDAITTSIFETALKPLINQERSNLIFETGVLFPSKIGDKISIEYYFKNNSEFNKRIDKIKTLLKDIEGVDSVETIMLERYTGD